MGYLGLWVGVKSLAVCLESGGSLKVWGLRIWC